MPRTRTITMPEMYHKKARVLAVALNEESLSSLFRYFIDKEWSQRPELDIMLNQETNGGSNTHEGA